MQRGMPVLLLLLLLLRILSDASKRHQLGLPWLLAVGWQKRSSLIQ